MLANEDQMRAFRELFDTGKELTYKKGEFIIRPGESLSGIFYIKSGIVKAYDITKYGEENLLVIRKHDEIFPLIWAITGQERDIVYQALAPTVLFKINRPVFFNAIKDSPGSMLPVIDMIVEMYRIHSERILNLEYRTVRERLASFLLTMSNRFGIEHNGLLTFEVPLKQQDIASSINATRETTSRELKILEKHGLVSIKNSIITILDHDKLQAML
jgi:CRP/FNR family transcriptional regulator